MKKFLLLGAAVLIAVSASATNPVKRSDAVLSTKNQPVKQVMPKANKEFMEMRTPGTPVVKAPKKSDYIDVWYNRPAGAFYVNYISVDGDYGYAYSAPFLFMKPFSSYIWKGFTDGEDENTTYSWDIFHSEGDQGTDTDDPFFMVDNTTEVEVAYDLEIDQTAQFWAIDGPLDGDGAWYSYQMKDHEMENPSKPTKVSETPVNIFSIPNASVMGETSEVDYWCSSKSMVGGGRNADSYYLMTAYYGATEYPGNEYGWWFGKNGDHIDGQAVAFEKPAAPYLLKKVGWRIDDEAEMEGSVTLTCNVYKLNSIPAYSDEGSVRLPEEPGELIVTGEATFTSADLEANYGLVEFTLFAHDEDDPDLVYEFTPTIDYPILVTIEGYNDEEAANLKDFTAYISTDDAVDEGYGELAYLKYPVYEMEISDAGDTTYNYTGEHVWRGLNNFFRSGEMKTAFSIYISTENPFIIFNYGLEDGQYLFPNEGGELEKTFEYSDTTVVSEGIEFFATYPSDEWMLKYNGLEDNLPSWLTIKLNDEGTYPTGTAVTAEVTAEPLPDGVKGREAVIRFETPGAYIDYKFMQGEVAGLVGDVNGDGLVNISDVNAVINMILAGTYDASGDINGDGSVNIGDINALIAIILG